MLLDAASARLLGLPPMGAFLASTCRSPQHGLARRAENSARASRGGGVVDTLGIPPSCITLYVHLKTPSEIFIGNGSGHTRFRWAVVEIGVAQFKRIFSVPLRPTDLSLFSLREDKLQRHVYCVVIEHKRQFVESSAK
jgi:hypothetical protein